MHADGRSYSEVVVAPSLHITGTGDDAFRMLRGHSCGSYVHYRRRWLHAGGSSGREVVDTPSWHITCSGQVGHVGLEGGLSGVTYTIGYDGFIHAAVLAAKSSRHHLCTPRAWTDQFRMLQGYSWGSYVRNAYRGVVLSSSSWFGNAS